MVIHYLWKLISTFYKDHLHKPIAIFILVNTAFPIARFTSMELKNIATKQKCGWLTKANSITKWAKKSWVRCGFYFVSSLFQKIFQSFLQLFKIIFLLLPHFDFSSLIEGDFFYSILSIFLGTKNRYSLVFFSSFLLNKEIFYCWIIGVSSTNSIKVLEIFHIDLEGWIFPLL